METAGPAKSWERAWTTEEMRQNAGSWSLAGDAGLLNHLKEFSQRLLSRTHATATSLDSLFDELNSAATDINNTTNAFLSLSNTQFVESRVYEDEVKVTPVEVKPQPDKVLTKVELEAEMVARVTESLQIGMSVLDNMFNVVEVPGSDTDTDDESPSSIGRTILEAKNPYLHRPLPYLIGSKDFMEDDRVGLGELFSDDEPVTPPQARSGGGRLDLHTANTMAHRMSDSLSDDSDVDTKPQPPPLSDSLFEPANQEAGDMFGRESPDEFKPRPPVAAPAAAQTKTASFADELAAKLGGVASQSVPTNRKASSDKMADMFSPDAGEEEEDSLFGPREGKFSGGRGLFDDLETQPVKQVIPEASKPAVKPAEPARTAVKDQLFGDVDDIFGTSNQDDDDDMFSVRRPAQGSANQSSAADEVGKKKLPHGGISIFSDNFLPTSGELKAGKQLLSAASSEGATNSPPAADKLPPNPAEPPIRATKLPSLFNDEDSDDLFSVTPSRTVAAKPKPVSEPNPSTKRDSVSLFDDSNRITSEPKQSSYRKPISLFDDPGDDVKSPADSIPTTMNRKPTISLFDDKDGGTKTSTESKPTAVSLFDEANASATKPKATNRKAAISLFDESDSGEDEMLFSSTSSPSTHSRRSVASPEKRPDKSAIFANDDALFAEPANKVNFDIFGGGGKPLIVGKQPADLENDDIFAVPSAGKSATLFDFDDDTIDDLFAVPRSKETATVVATGSDETDDLFAVAAKPISARLFDELNAMPGETAKSPADKKPEPPKTLNIRKTIDLFGGDDVDDVDDIFSLSFKSDKKKPVVVEKDKSKSTIANDEAIVADDKVFKESPKMSANLIAEELMKVEALVPNIETVKEGRKVATKPAIAPRETKRPDVAPRSIVVDPKEAPTKPIKQDAEVKNFAINRVKSPLGLVIDPKTLLPGAKPPKTAPKEETTTVNNPTGLFIDPMALLPEAKPPKEETNMVKGLPGLIIKPMEHLSGAKPPKEETNMVKGLPGLIIKPMEHLSGAKPPKEETNKVKSPPGLFIDPMALLPGAKPPKEETNMVKGLPGLMIKPMEHLPGEKTPKEETNKVKSRPGLFIDPMALLHGARHLKESLQGAAKEGAYRGGDDTMTPPADRDVASGKGAFTTPRLGAGGQGASFEDPPEAIATLHSVAKERAKIPVKRRPQSRRARQEAIRTSAIFPDDSPTFPSVDNPEQHSSTDFYAPERHVPDNNDTKKQLFLEQPRPIPASISGNLNPLSPSTDEEDLFGVPQDMYEGGEDSRSGNLFRGATVLSPPEERQNVVEDMRHDSLFGSTNTSLFADVDSLFTSSNAKEGRSGTAEKESDCLFDNDEDLFVGKTKPALRGDPLFGGETVRKDGISSGLFGFGDVTLPSDNNAAGNLFGTGDTSLPTDDLFNKKVTGNTSLLTDDIFDQKVTPANITGNTSLLTDDLFDKKTSPGNAADMFGTGNTSLPTEDIFNKKVSSVKSTNDKSIPTTKKASPANDTNLFGNTSLPTGDLFSKKVSPGNDGDLFGAGSAGLPTDDLFSAAKKSATPRSVEGDGDLFAVTSGAKEGLSFDAEESLFGAPTVRKVSATSLKTSSQLFDDGDVKTDIFSSTKTATKSATRPDKSLFDDDDDDDIFGAASVAKRPTKSTAAAPGRQDGTKRPTKSIPKTVRSTLVNKTDDTFDDPLMDLLK